MNEFLVPIVGLGYKVCEYKNIIENQIEIYGGVLWTDQ